MSALPRGGSGAGSVTRASTGVRREGAGELWVPAGKPVVLSFARQYHHAALLITRLVEGLHQRVGGRLGSAMRVGIVDDTAPSGHVRKSPATANGSPPGAGNLRRARGFPHCWNDRKNPTTRGTHSGRERGHALSARGVL